MELTFKLGKCAPPLCSPTTRKSLWSPAAPAPCLSSSSARVRNSRPPCNVSQFSITVSAPRNILPCYVVALVRRKSRTLRLQASKMLPVNGEGDGKIENPQGQVPEGVIELEDAAAFGNVVHGKGLISICGFGSLLSEKSARYTFPNLLNFRVAVLPGFRRVFAHVAPVFLERGIANVVTKEMSSLSVEPCPGESVIVTVFEISLVEVPAFIEREHEFRFLGVTLHSLQGQASSNKAVICSRYSDKEYRQHRCQDNAEYHRRYGRFNIDQIWRDDILPCRVYLRHCVLAAKNLSEEAYDSFLDHTYLGDRITTIRKHLAADKQIMQEEPPPSLQERYGG